MKKYEKEILLGCGCIGAVLDIVGIVTAFKSSIGILLLAVGMVIFVSAFVLLLKRYRESREDARFVDYLHRSKMNVLPKVFLMINNDKEYRKMAVRKMTVKYIFNEENFGDVSESGKEMKYTGKIEYNLEVENKNVPEEHACYLTNACMRNGAVELFQRHGTQKNWERVIPRKDGQGQMEKCVVLKHDWKIKRENLTQADTFPLDFYFEYDDCMQFGEAKVFVSYPWQTSEKLGEIELLFQFPGDKITIEKSQLYSISKVNGEYKHTACGALAVFGDTASLTYEPLNRKHEAYTLEVHWKKVE